MTQPERIAGHLIRNAQGLTAVDCVNAPTFDGGAPILRLASRMARVRELLAARGYELVTDGRRNKCVVYRARRTVPASAPNDDTEPLALVDRRVGVAPPRSALDPWPWDGDR